MLTVVLAAVAITNVWLRVDAERTHDTAQAVESEVAERQIRIAQLREDEAAESGRRETALDAVARATTEVAEAERVRDELLAELEQRRGERRSAEAAAGARAAEVDVVEDRAQANDAVIADLERCLEHATRAANSLAVGDLTRAFEALELAAVPCERIGVTIR